MPHLSEDEHTTCANDDSVKVKKFVATVFVDSRITNREASLVAAETGQEHTEVRAIPAAAQSHDLRGVDLAGLDLTGIDLKGRNLSGASLIGATLRSARLDGCDLSNANLSAADLTGASLTASVLSDAVLCDAVLVGACLKNAQLSYTDSPALISAAPILRRHAPNRLISETFASRSVSSTCCTSTLRG